MAVVDRLRADSLFWLLFFTLTVLNGLVIGFSPLGLSPDEAHYWEWSRRLDWSYYSKGPLVAYMIAASTALLGDTVFAVRLPTMLCYALFTAVFYFFLRRRYLPSQALLAWLALRSMLMFAQTGVLMTTDSAAALFWLLALVSAYAAIVEERRDFWIAFGLSIGCGVSAKYTLAILYLSIVLYLLLTPRIRHHLLSWQFALGTALMFVAMSPIFYWNMEHGWVNFSHNAGHLVKSEGFSISLLYLPELILGQAGLVGPIVFAGLVFALYRGISVWRRGDIAAGVFLFSALPLTVLVIGVSFLRRVYANWPLPIYIGALCLFLHLISLRRINDGKINAWMRGGLILSAAITLASHLPFLGFTLGLPGKVLPSKKLIGWKELGGYMGSQVSQSLGRNMGMPFVLGDDYEVVSALAFYTNPKPEFYCAKLDDRRMNQYDIWDGWERLKGRAALIVLKSPDRVELLRSHFASIEPLGSQPVMRVEYGGSLLREFYVYTGRGYDGSSPEMPTKR